MANAQVTPIPKDDKEAILAALVNYKKQNPVKYEAKKAALFKKYGLEDVQDEEVIEKKDASDVELEELTKKVKKTKAKKAE